MMLWWPLNSYSSALTRVVVVMGFVWLMLFGPSSIYASDSMQNVQADFTQSADITLMGKKGPPKSKVGSGNRSGLKGRGKAAGKPRMKRQGMRSAARFKNRNNTARSKYSGKNKTAPRYARSKLKGSGGKNLTKNRTKPSRAVSGTFTKNRNKPRNSNRKGNSTGGSKRPKYLDNKLAKKNNLPALRAAKLTQKQFEHIVERHWHSSGAQNAGKFGKHVTGRDLKRLIQETVSNGKARKNTNVRPGVLYQYKFKTPIGTNMHGKSTNKLRVVVSAGNVVTAFPY